MNRTSSILIIRRDNIGDLVCTTPLLRALRQAHPSAWIAVLVNSYNAPVLKGNQDIDEVLCYRKAKHSEGETVVGLLLDRVRLGWRLRRRRWDAVLVASPGARAERLAAFVGAGRVLVRGARDGRRGRVEMVAEGGGHEVERAFALGARIGAAGPPPPSRVFASSGTTPSGAYTLGIHISARKPSQRWPLDRFVALVRALDADWRLRLFWAPGVEGDARHPGDDRKAANLSRTLGDRVEPFPTRSLGQLMDGLAGCDSLFCSDGGAMHLAAGLGLPITCMFGDSDAERWHPWGVPYQLLQPTSRHVDDVGVAAVLAAIRELAAAEYRPT